MQEHGLQELLNEVKLIGNEILIETSNFNEIQVYSIEGRLVHVSKTKSIIVEDWVPGTYVVTVLSKENSAHSTRIVVK